MGQLRTSLSFSYAYPPVNRTALLFSFPFLPRQIKEQVQWLLRAVTFKRCSRNPWVWRNCLKGPPDGWKWMTQKRRGKSFTGPCLSSPLPTRSCTLCFSFFTLCALKLLPWSERWLIDVCHPETNLIIFNV